MTSVVIAPHICIYVCSYQSLQDSTRLRMSDQQSNIIHIDSRYLCLGDFEPFHVLSTQEPTGLPTVRPTDTPTRVSSFTHGTTAGLARLVDQRYLANKNKISSMSVLLGSRPIDALWISAPKLCISHTVSLQVPTTLPSGRPTQVSERYTHHRPILISTSSFIHV